MRSQANTAKYVFRRSEADAGIETGSSGKDHVGCQPVVSDSLRVETGWANI